MFQRCLRPVTLLSLYCWWALFLWGHICGIEGKFSFKILKTDWPDKSFYLRVKKNPHLSAVTPPKIAPDAIPTAKPSMAPIFMRSKHDGPCPCPPYIDPTGAGIFNDGGYYPENKALALAWLFKGEVNNTEGVKKLQCVCEKLRWRF